jgi:Tol biopolymer transport system component
MNGRRITELVLCSVIGLALAACGGNEPSPTDPPLSPSPSGDSGSPASSPSPTPGASAAPSSLPTPLPASVTLPADGRIAYTAGGAGGEQWISLTAPDGSHPTRLAAGRDPTWSADGRTLVYACPTEGNEGDYPAICSIEAGRAGADPSVLVAIGDGPRLSPDGTRLAYHRGMVDVGETWVAAADGSGPGLLSPGALTDWSPDGRWLLGQPESAGREIAVIRADGSGYRVLAGGFDPAWSPDGDRIVYGIVTANGSSLRYLDVGTGLIRGLYLGGESAGLSAPTWLDGDAVLFVMSGDLWRLDADALAPVRLTSGLGVTGRLSLSPDRDWVVFATELVDGRPVTPVLAVASIEGGWRVLETDDAPVSQPVWRPAAGG